jgi:hypothetical protein
MAPRFWVVKRLPVQGMALYPFILIQKAESANDLILVRHELIHHRQQVECGILPFYLLYVLEYLFLRLSNTHHKAYLAISFEKEAYVYDTNPTYLTDRKPFAWLPFVSPIYKLFLILFFAFLIVFLFV